MSLSALLSVMRTRAPLLLSMCVAVFVPAGLASAATSDAVMLGRRQFCAFDLALRGASEAADEESAPEFARTLQPDGSWADIDYTSTVRSGWAPMAHGRRMQAMLAASHWAGATSTERTRLEAAVHRAFAYWMQGDFASANWWYNQVGVPQTLGSVALLLGPRLRPEEFRYVTETLLPRSKISKTGQNRIWLAGITLILGLLRSDEGLVKEAAETIWGQVEVVTAEGVQPDFSFHQHGPQLQTGNYGLAFAIEICRWATALRGTRWAMPPDRLAVYRGFMLEGAAWANWRGQLDISACGRHLKPQSPQEKSQMFANLLPHVALFDGEYSAAYGAWVARNEPEAVNDLVGHRVFWRSDYAVHRRPDHSATLKMSSQRVVGTESIIGENMLGYHLADGALYLYRRGDEYDEIFPVWDWQKLPGVTCVQRGGGPPSFREIRGERDFVGGVTDGAHGAAALDYQRESVRARKAWFFGEQETVCLGAGIGSACGEHIVTTLNQCLLRGPVTVKRSGCVPAAFGGGERTLTEVEWVEHDGWRYAFFQPATVHLQAGPRTGHWKRVFDTPDAPVADVTLDVFTLWIEHERASSDGYAYVIAPSSSAASSTALPLVDRSAWRQSVRFDSGAAAVFWTAGDAELAADLHVTVDQPCLVAFDARSGLMFVSDPTQKLARLKLKVNEVWHDVSLPQGGEAGRSVAVALVPK